MRWLGDGDDAVDDAAAHLVTLHDCDGEFVLVALY